MVRRFQRGSHGMSLSITFGPAPNLRAGLEDLHLDVESYRLRHRIVLQHVSTPRLGPAQETATDLSRYFPTLVNYPTRLQ